MHAKKYDLGKLRYDLLSPHATKGLVNTLSFGASKYGDRNWESGMSWSKIIASLKRHLAAIELGEDYDNESGLLHIDHLQCNAHFLAHYYRQFPQGDDRKITNYKIGLDIDEVLADWIGAWINKFNYTVPINWYFSYSNKEHFQSMSSEEMVDFYLNIPVKTPASELAFEPSCYITARSIDNEITKQWIQNNNFPTVPVYSVPFGESKVEIAKKAGIDIFIEDNYHNFVDLNNNGICCYLLTRPHNAKYNVGHKRINHINDLPFLQNN